jgi:F-type H+-transporting ATPase subunit epsilon
MPETFRLTVLTPTRTVLDARVQSIVAPGSEGYLGVLANHAPLITALIPGKLSVKDEHGAVRAYAVGGGFLEVSENRANVLADSIEEPGEIDMSRAREALERARGRLKDPPGRWDVERAEAALKRALNRIKVAGEGS